MVIRPGSLSANGDALRDPGTRYYKKTMIADLIPGASWLLARQLEIAITTLYYLIYIK